MSEKDCDAPSFNDKDDENEKYNSSSSDEEEILLYDDDENDDINKKQQDLEVYRNNMLNAALDLCSINYSVSSTPSNIFDIAISTWHVNNNKIKNKRLTPPEVIALSLQYYGTPSKGSAANEWQNFVKWRCCYLSKTAFCEIVNLIEICGGGSSNKTTAKEETATKRIKDSKSYADGALTTVVDDFVHWANNEYYQLEPLEKYKIGQLPTLRETEKWELGMYEEVEHSYAKLWGKKNLPCIDVSNNVQILSQHHLRLGNLCVLVSLQMALSKVCRSSSSCQIETLLELSKHSMCTDGYNELIKENGVHADDLFRLAKACCDYDMNTKGNTKGSTNSMMTAIRFDPPTKSEISVVDFQKLIYDILLMTNLPILFGYRLQCGLEKLYVAHAAILVGMDINGNAIIQDPHSYYNDDQNKWIKDAGKYTISFGRFYESFHADAFNAERDINYFVQIGNGNKDQFNDIIYKYKNILNVHDLYETTTADDDDDDKL
jgi:hypothetical protein